MRSARRFFRAFSPFFESFTFTRARLPAAALKDFFLVLRGVFLLEITFFRDAKLALPFTASLNGPRMKMKRPRRETVITLFLPDIGIAGGVWSPPPPPPVGAVTTWTGPVVTSN